jgi:hypothetical protein
MQQQDRQHQNRSVFSLKPSGRDVLGLGWHGCEVFFHRIVA